MGWGWKWRCGWGWGPGWGPGWGRCCASLEVTPLRCPLVPQKLEFLQLFGLTTQQQKEELLSQKRRKRRRMLRERSPSPPTVQNKRRTPSPRLPLSTRYSPDEMNNSPNFEEKKRFLTIFNLTHISADKRKGNARAPRPAGVGIPSPPAFGVPPRPAGGRELAPLSRGSAKTSASHGADKEKLVEMLQAMKQKPAPGAVVVKSSPRDSPSGPVAGEPFLAFFSLSSGPFGSIPAGPQGCRAWGSYPPLPPAEPPVQPLLLDPEKAAGIAEKAAEPGRLEQLRAPELPRVKEPTALGGEKPPRLSDGHPGKKALSILSYVRGPLPKDIPVPLSHSVNGKSKPWEPFIAEEFAHQFHESVLQSTQKALQKHKGAGGAQGTGDPPPHEPPQRVGTTQGASLWGNPPVTPLPEHPGE